MTDKEFIALCKKVVCEYANEQLDKTDGKQITENDVYIVWLCKTLQNNKALVSTTLLDGTYYELTFNGDMNVSYVDVYEKRDNYCVNRFGERIYRIKLLSPECHKEDKP